MGLPYEWTGLRGRGGARPGRAGVRARPAGARPGRGPRGLRRGAWRPPCQAAARSGRPPSLGERPCGPRAQLRGSRFRPRARAFAVGRGLPRLPGGPQRPAAREGRPRTRQRLPPPRRSCSAPRPASVCRGEGGWAGARLLLREGAGARRVPGSRAPPAGSSRTSAHSPRKLEPWRLQATKPPRCQVWCVIRLHVRACKEKEGVGEERKIETESVPFRYLFFLLRSNGECPS